MRRTVIVPGILIISVILTILPGLIPQTTDPRYQFESFVKYTYTPSIPDEFLDIYDAGARKQYLLTILLPMVLKTNAEVESERRSIERIKSTWLWLSRREELFLEQLAGKYKVETGDYDAMIEDLLVKVDVLPPSLILAQAAIESGWGTSRFAVDGNNLFGLRTPSGEGMVPRQQGEGMVFRVSRFEDLQSNIDYYLWNINTHHKYEELRGIRSGSAYPYDPVELAGGLRHYSEMGDEYVEKLVRIIEYNNLKDYDGYGLE
ncbi:MAG TPA: hypothetical protein ENN05_09455 [Deltaproteobacteria bacterium]|nr:hypothetical protein [Deltaproteobacteria bacterium]